MTACTCLQDPNNQIRLLKAVQLILMSASSFATSNGGDTRDARDDERQNPIIPVQPINGVCRVYIAPPPTADDNELFCRICHDTKSDNVTPLISPCRCTGSSALVHQACIENWLTLSGRESCDLCNYRLPVYKTLKPIREWVSTPLEIEDGLVVLITILAHISFIINIVAVVFQSITVSTRADTIAIFNLAALLIGSLWSITTVIFMTLGTWCSPNWEEWREVNTKIKLRELVYVDRYLRDVL